MADIEDIESWIGAAVVDPDGAKIGKLDEILVDHRTGQAVYAVTKTSVLGRRHTVPLHGATFSRGHVRVLVPKELADAAPQISGDTVLGSDAATLRRHYGLDDDGSHDPDEVELETASSLARRRAAFEADQARAEELEREAERKDGEASDHRAASSQEEGTASAAEVERDRLRAEAARLRGETPG
jgi:hypothetical protein